MYSNPTVSYKYSDTIRNKVLNYRQTILGSDSQSVFTCNCDKYSEEFVNNDFGHIFTGDLKIVNNKELREVLENGLNYREPQSPDKNKTISAVIAGLDAYVSQVSERTSTPIACCSLWKSEIMKTVRSKISKCNSYKCNNVLSKPYVTEYLKKLTMTLFLFLLTRLLVI